MWSQARIRVSKPSRSVIIDVTVDDIGFRSSTRYEIPSFYNSLLDLWGVSVSHRVRRRREIEEWSTYYYLHSDAFNSLMDWLLGLLWDSGDDYEVLVPLNPYYRVLRRLEKLLEAYSVGRGKLIR